MVSYTNKIYNFTSGCGVVKYLETIAKCNIKIVAISLKAIVVNEYEDLAKACSIKSGKYMSICVLAIVRCWYCHVFTLVVLRAQCKLP